MKKRDPQHGNAGFTLVEMLVAIALLSLMVTYAYTAVSGFRHIKRAEHRLDSQQAIEAALRHLRLMISNAKVAFVQEPDGSARLLFDGLPNQLSLISQLDDRLVRGGLHWLTYRLDDEGSAVVLTYGVRRNVYDAGDTEIILEGASGLSFRYYGAAAEGEDIQWQTAWPRNEALPKLVEVRIALDERFALKDQVITIPIEATR